MLFVSFAGDSVVSAGVFLGAPEQAPIVEAPSASPTSLTLPLEPATAVSSDVAPSEAEVLQGEEAPKKKQRASAKARRRQMRRQEREAAAAAQQVEQEELQPLHQQEDWQPLQQQQQVPLLPAPVGQVPPSCMATGMWHYPHMWVPIHGSCELQHQPAALGMPVQGMPFAPPGFLPMSNAPMPPPAPFYNGAVIGHAPYPGATMQPWL